VSWAKIGLKKYLAHSENLDSVVSKKTLSYPIAQTQDKNCWSEPPVDIFCVRGANYLRDKIKVDSGPYLLRARGCDLFLSETPQQCVIGE
jgi:hypothetical protein